LLRSQIDIRSLVIFQQVAASANMTIAAQRLGITQSAVSQTVRQLEKSLGTTLIDRSSRPLSVTAAGVTLQRRADRILDEIEAIPAALMHAAHQQLPVIRVGLVDTFATTAGSRLIKELMDSAVRTQVESGLSPELGDALLNRRLDLIITTDALENVDGLERQPIWHEPFVIVTPRSWPAAAMRLSLPELASAGALIRYTAHSHLGAQIERHLRRSRVVPPRRLEIDSSEAVLAMVAEGVGWTITTPLCLMQGRMHIDNIKVSPMPKPGASRSLTLVGRADEYNSVLHQFADVARAILTKQFLSAILMNWPWLEGTVTVGVPDID
jgi:DNA-binding transcriptional LysR family regulator